MSRSASRGRRLGERLAGNVVFPAWARREHPGYARFRRELERTQFLAPEALASLQRERLRALLRHADDHCPFYRERFRAAGLRPGEPWDVNAWQALPVLTKREIQDHGRELEAATFSAKDRVRNQTGGSTGSPLQFWVDRARFATRMASTYRHDAWTGYRPGDWLATAWGARLDAVSNEGWWERRRNQLLYRTVSLNTSSVSEEDWRRFIAGLRRYRPRFLLAYATGAVALAEQVRERGLDDIRFEAIICSAEVLSASQRQTIEDALGGKVYNRYGSREVSVIASECGQHNGLHVNAEALLVEIVPMAGLPAPWGQVVITDLLNRSMPLIRYAIGDVARWAEGACACGRGLPRLAEVQGRTTEFLRLPDGRVVSGPALTLVVADMANVRQVQFVQQGDRQVVLRVVPGHGYQDGVREELRRRLELYLRGSLPLRIEEVGSIPCEASGKYRFVVQEGAA